MNTITLTSEKNRYLISLDKNYFKKEMLTALLEQLRVQYLGQKLDFDKSIEMLGEEIKHNWWKRNKKRFIKNK